MKLLLDTHIWLCALGHPGRLDREILRLLDHPGNELLLSPISIWEAGQLARDGRIRVRPTFPQWLDMVLLRIRVQEAPLNFAVAAEAARITLPQNDLGDRFLAATASVFNLTLVTEDPQLLACKWLKTLP